MFRVMLATLKKVYLWTLLTPLRTFMTGFILFVVIIISPRIPSGDFNTLKIWYWVLVFMGGILGGIILTARRKHDLATYLTEEQSKRDDQT